jgi:hypothetical protein
MRFFDVRQSMRRAILFCLLASACVDAPDGDQTRTDSICDPNYDPCVPMDTDVDCAGGRGNGPSYVPGPVRVTRTDVYDLDRDGDGIGCDG